MSSSKKYYVVWKGVTPGIYDNWDECKKQVFAFDGAQYKSYKTITEAKIAFSKPYVYPKPQYVQTSLLQNNIIPISESISVDASLNTNTLKMEYRGVYTSSKKLIFHQGPFDDATNNIGEFLAIVHALAQCKKENIIFPVYSDSRTAISWIKKKKAKTKLKHTDKNKKLFELIERDEKWLKENTYSNQILKWDTKLWGEIPADFGRK